MDRDIIRQMAREAGLAYWTNNRWWMDASEVGEELERFFQLATEWQRNKDIEICSQVPMSFYAALEIKRQGEMK